MMHLLLSFVIHTANILGIFNDPFEFEGDYGTLVNPIRQEVFELVVSHKILSDPKEYGPSLGQIVTPDLIEEIKKKEVLLAFSDSDFDNILTFIERYKNEKVFHFLRNNPPELLSLDKTLRDQAAQKGTLFDLPILGSTAILRGENSFELKRNLIEALFTKENIALTKPQSTLTQAVQKLDPCYLQSFVKDGKEFEVFTSPIGQLFFYWLYHSLNLELISTKPQFISQVNQVKEIFTQTLGNPVVRANSFKQKLLQANTAVLFTQECDGFVIQTLTDKGEFHLVDRQNRKDGTLVFLKSDLWNPDYEIIPIETYEGSVAGRLNVILARKKDSDERFLLASCHGHSTRAEDGRLQIEKIMEKFHQLNDGSLQLIIGIDANTKTEKDVHLFKEHLDKLGLLCTEVGPTTIKKRMVTAQHAKAGQWAIDEEDYLITLKPECGGYYQLRDLTVGFKPEKADCTQPLPNVSNPSDHYPVGALLEETF